MPNSSQRLHVGVPLVAMEIREAAQVVVVGSKTPGRHALGAFDLGQLQLRRDGADDPRRHLVLQLEDVGQLAVETVGPKVRAGRRLDQLAGDAQPVIGPSHAALEHVAHAELAADLPDVDRAPLVGEGRVARDDEQRRKARERRDDVLDHTVGKIVIRLAAEIVERQDRDRGLLGKVRQGRLGYLADEAIALAGCRHDVALAFVAVGERLAQGRDMDLDGVVLDEHSGPDARHQLVLADDIAAHGRQHAQNVEAARTERHAGPVAIECPAPHVDAERTECDLLAAIGNIRHDGCFSNSGPNRRPGAGIIGA